MFKRLCGDLLSLLFPDICYACGTGLFPGERLLCSHCMFDLPFTDFHLDDTNKAARQLWGRIELNAVMALLYFKKAGKVQKIVHHLKYRGRTELGVFLGELIAARMRESNKYACIEIILPVPLHAKRLKERGYNQAAFIGAGIAEKLHLPCSEKLLVRTSATQTQTKKSRYTRYENMKDVFTVSFPAEIVGKHILLVDDVLTTGATLEACGNVLLANGAASVSIATAAFSE